MTTIQLYTADRKLILLSQRVIASGGRETVRLAVRTDAAWTGYRLSAILFCDGQRELTQEIPLDGAGSCTVPPQLLRHPGVLQIGLRGLTDDEDTDADAACRTSTLVRCRIAEGAPPEAGEPLVNATDATAAEDTVLAGETFYAGAGEAARIGNILTYEEGTPTALTPYTESDPTVPAWAKKPEKPSYTAAEVGARPANWTPTAAEVGARPANWTPTAAEVGARPADWTPTAAEVGARPADWTPAESDPTVPAWAKAETKPSYTADEVGARPDTWTPKAEDIDGLDAYINEKLGVIENGTY